MATGHWPVIGHKKEWDDESERKELTWTRNESESENESERKSSKNWPVPEIMIKDDESERKSSKNWPVPEGPLQRARG